MGSYCQNCRGSHLFTPHQLRVFSAPTSFSVAEKKMPGVLWTRLPRSAWATGRNIELLLPPPQTIDFPTHTRTWPPTASRNLLNLPKYERQFFPHLASIGDPFPRGFTGRITGHLSITAAITGGLQSLQEPFKEVNTWQWTQQVVQGVSQH